MFYRMSLCATSLCLVASLGCGGAGTSSYDVAPVTGTIKMDGKPMANVSVIFTPIPGEELNADSMLGPSSMAVTDSQGNFELKIPTTGQVGAVVGQHQVAINVVNERDDQWTDEMPADTGNLPVIPRRYNDETQLKFTVPENGSNGANFELDSRPDPPPGTGY